MSTPSPSEQNWCVNGRTISAGTVLPDLSYTFSTPGTYKLQLINTYETCPDTTAKTITVKPSPVTTGFDVDLQGACGAPVTVQFTDTTQDAVSWQWDFTGNGTFSDEGQTPFSYLYFRGHLFRNLKITGENGCSTEITKPVSVHKIKASIRSSARRPWL